MSSIIRKMQIEPMMSTGSLAVQSGVGGAAKTNGEMITTGEMQRKLPSEAGLRKQILSLVQNTAWQFYQKCVPKRKEETIHGNVCGHSHIVRWNQELAVVVCAYNSRRQGDYKSRASMGFMGCSKPVWATLLRWGEEEADRRRQCRARTMQILALTEFVELC